MKKLLIVALIIALAFVATLAQVYKWVDEEGVVHYGDSPPQNTESEEIHVEGGKARKADESVSKLLKQAEESAKQRAGAKQEKTAAAEAQAEKRQERQNRCNFARKQLISLQQQLPVYKDEEGTFRTVSRYDVYAGQREYLDDKAREIEIARVQREITALCEHPDDRQEQLVSGRERMMSKRCEAALVYLESVERPEARSPRQTIEEARLQVEKYCQN